MMAGIQRNKLDENTHPGYDVHQPPLPAQQSFECSLGPPLLIIVLTHRKLRIVRFLRVVAFETKKSTRVTLHTLRDVNVYKSTQPVIL